MTAYGHVGTYATPPHPYLHVSAPRSHGKLRRMLTGTGVESNFRFVVHLELKPARTSIYRQRGQDTAHTEKYIETYTR